MSLKTKNLVVILVAFLAVSAEGFNLFEFLERKFSNVRPVYQPNPQQRRTHRRPPAPRWPQLQYNYDKPVDNVIEEQPPQPQPAPVQPPRSHQYRPHYVEQPTPQYQHPPQPQYEQPQYEQPQYEQPQKHIDPYRPQHFEYKEPEQPADIPVVQGTIRHQGPPAGFVHTESTTQPPSQPAARYPEYDEIEIITAPPLGGHRHYGPTYEVQVGTNFNAGQ